MKLFSFFREASPALPEKAELTLSELFDEHYYPHALVAKAQPRDDLSTFNTQIREDLGAMKLSEVTNPVLAKWVRQRIIAGYQRSTINKYIHLMNRMLSLAKTWGMVPPFNPNQEKIKTISVGDFKQRFLSEEEIARLLKACRRSSHPFLSLFIRLLLLTGARKGEALGMRWCDIDFAKRIWTVPKSKNGRSRRIILSEPAIDVLNAARKRRNIWNYLLIHEPRSLPIQRRINLMIVSMPLGISCANGPNWMMSAFTICATPLPAC